MGPHDDIRTSIQQRKLGDIVVLTPTGDVDPTIAPALERIARARIKDGDLKIAVDLASAEVLTSLGLQVLIRIQKALRPEGGRLVLYSLEPMAREILEKTRLDTVLTVREDLDAAKRYLITGE